MDIKDLLGKCLCRIKGWESRKGVSSNPSESLAPETKDGQGEDVRQLQSLKEIVATVLPSWWLPTANSEVPKTICKLQ